MPLAYEAEFRALGSSLHERLDLQRVDPTYRLVFGDGTQLSLTSDMSSMRAQLESIQPGGFNGLLRYLQEGNQHYRLAMDKLVNLGFRKASDFVTLQTLSLLFRLKPLIRHQRNVSRYFNDPRLKAAFTFQDGYMGMSPLESPATFSFVPFTELAHGVWYPKGGMYSVAETLTDLARDAGAEFIFNTAVERIDTQAAGARGVLLADGHRLEADVVLANADLPYVYQSLLPQDEMSKAVSRKRLSCSAISFFWGVDKTYEVLGPHTYFPTDNERENYEGLSRNPGLPGHPNIYIHAPARLDPSMAPRGHDSLTAIVPVGHLREGGEQRWDELRNEARRDVLGRLRELGIHDLDSHIKFEETYTPLSWRRRYNLTKGSTHGLSHRVTQLGYFRPANRHPRYRNLYFVGASTHPGTGIPTAMISGRLVSERIVDELPASS
jgi:phytoene desaturase